MRVTLIGHASLLVEMDGCTCLMDPIFFDPFEEGAVVTCPRRQAYPERRQHVDLLIVSHRHPDHFDLRSLAQVPRDVDAIVPADPLIVHALRRLGFTHIHPVHPMAPILSDRFELYPTRSALRSIQEFGMVFKDASGVVWNQVDSLLTPETIDEGGVRVAGGTHAEEADLVHRIAASPLAGWIAHERSFYSVRAYSRRYDTSYEVAAAEGRIRLERRRLPDLLMHYILMHYILNVAPGSATAAKQELDRQMAAMGWGARPGPGEGPSREWERLARP